MISDAEFSAWEAKHKLPDKPPWFVLNLAQMPHGMMDQILMDLPVYRVLQILLYGTQAMKDSVFSNQHYRQVFTSQADAAPVLELFLLHRDICWFKHKPFAKQWSLISNTFGGLDRGRHIPREGWRRPAGLSILENLQNELRTSISIDLKLYLTDEQLLLGHSSEAFPSIGMDNNTESLKTRWNLIKRLKLSLNLTKSLQKARMADMVAAYPGRLRLKKLLDPSQDGPRPNTEHIVNSFKTASQKILKDRKLDHPYGGFCSRGVDCIEVVPYDKYLWLFLDIIKKYPPSVEGHDAQIDRLTEDMTLVDIYEYPEQISASIKVVNQGLLNIYTGSPELIVPRIDWNPVSSASGPANPVFFMDSKPHPKTLPENLHRCPVRKIMPYDEREYEWLKAFLEVVTWMEDHMDEIQSGVTLEHSA